MTTHNTQGLITAVCLMVINGVTQTFSQTGIPKELPTSGFSYTLKGKHSYVLENRALFAEPADDLKSFSQDFEFEYWTVGKKFKFQLSNTNSYGDRMLALEAGYDGTTFHVLHEKEQQLAVSSRRPKPGKPLTDLASPYQILTLPFSIVPPGLKTFPRVEELDSFKITEALNRLSWEIGKRQGNSEIKIEAEGNDWVYVYGESLLFPAEFTVQDKATGNPLMKIVVTQWSTGAFKGWPKELTATTFLEGKPVQISEVSVSQFSFSADTDFSPDFKRAKQIRDTDAKVNFGTK